MTTPHQIQRIDTLSRAAAAAARAGDFDAARADCLRIFAIDPGNLNALMTYTSITRFTPEDPVLSRLRQYAVAPHLPAWFRGSLHFLLGKALDDMGDHRTAFDAFVTANKLKGAAFDTKAARLTLTHTLKAMPRGLTPLPAEGPRMVFVIGMPRSGTSLLAQMLGAHPGALNMGEQTALGQALLAPVRGFDPAGAHAALTQDRLPALRAAVLAALPPDAVKAGQGGRILIDKMPENYWFAAAIPLLFPDALILHARREKLAVCWSCFRHEFNEAHAYSYDFKSVQVQYDIHEALCEAARARAGAAWHEVRLDDLTAAPRDTLMPVLDALGLPWDEACLAPEKADGGVDTISRWQVRRGIDAGISQGWRAYLPYMQKKWGVRPPRAS